VKRLALGLDSDAAPFAYGDESPPALHADMTHKQHAIDRTRPLAAKPGRYRPPDPMLSFLEGL
jgi:hypothetical protein